MTSAQKILLVILTVVSVMAFFLVFKIVLTVVFFLCLAATAYYVFPAQLAKATAEIKEWMRRMFPK
jgi:hypothetical protein